MLNFIGTVCTRMERFIKILTLQRCKCQTEWNRGFSLVPIRPSRGHLWKGKQIKNFGRKKIKKLVTVSNFL
jgi:hypothetical protein